MRGASFGFWRWSTRHLSSRSADATTRRHAERIDQVADRDGPLPGRVREDAIIATGLRRVLGGKAKIDDSEPARSSRIAAPRRCSRHPSIPTPRPCWRRRPEHAHSGRLATIPGTPPGLHDRPAGCLFGPRCAYATARSQAVRPDLRDWMAGRVRCHYPLGDPERDARIAADGGVGAERGAMSALSRRPRPGAHLRGGRRPVAGPAPAAGGGRDTRSRSCRAGPWRWSANRAAENRPSRGW